MFQAMSFTDYGVSPGNLNDFWRTQTFHERFDDLDAPVFIDSGGFKLMNSNTFGDAPEEGGVPNEWGLYTDPKSILGLQLDFGADIVATLDYPIPPRLKEEEKVERMNRSIDSAVECLQILDDPGLLEERFEVNKRAAKRLRQQKKDEEEPGVYVALHGHDYETVSWYVGNFIERVEDVDADTSFEGFAIGSLVPLRDSVRTLVDIVQGAKDAIPESRADEIGIHVFGVGGKQVGLLSLLGVDSFDCSTHMQTARYKKYLHPDTWVHHELDELDDHLDPDGAFPCDLPNCTLCTEESVGYEEMVNLLNSDMSRTATMERKENGKPIKSDYYALLARHNFEVYNRELREVRKKIDEGKLLEHVIDFAREHDDIKRGLKNAQVRDKRLRKDLESRGAYDLLPGSNLNSDQMKLSEWGAGADESFDTQRISLKYSPGDFNVLSQSYTPPSDREILLVIPCSQKKPYSESRTHSVLFDKLSHRTSNIHKVTISGMYGPVPEECERQQPVTEYDYVLAKEDTDQIKLVTNRLTEYLNRFGDRFDHVLGYVTSKTYRQVTEDSFERYGRGTVFPRDPTALQLTEFFRNDNIDELISFIDEQTTSHS
ncbi:tRNA-guanine transglycosylase [Halococcoides cellulosivorans]|uniref:tRNA-guanine transglycosylase n=2 Tax=Halococcoides cellulosivorans TaxID=1679096 RepID=A0A2R4X4K6_9EURY|nr:tRNA-guanine transglycosylase [Halococcoides cellulosivorans]